MLPVQLVLAKVSQKRKKQWGMGSWIDLSSTGGLIRPWKLFFLGRSPPTKTKGSSDAKVRLPPWKTAVQTGFRSLSGARAFRFDGPPKKGRLNRRSQWPACRVESFDRKPRWLGVLPSDTALGMGSPLFASRPATSTPLREEAGIGRGRCLPQKAAAPHGLSGGVTGMAVQGLTRSVRCAKMQKTGRRGGAAKWVRPYMRVVYILTTTVDGRSRRQVPPPRGGGGGEGRLRGFRTGIVPLRSPREKLDCVPKD